MQPAAASEPIDDFVGGSGTIYSTFCAALVSSPNKLLQTRGRVASPAGDVTGAVWWIKECSWHEIKTPGAGARLPVKHFADISIPSEGRGPKDSADDGREISRHVMDIAPETTTFQPCGVVPLLASAAAW